MAAVSTIESQLNVTNQASASNDVNIDMAAEIAEVGKAERTLVKKALTIGFIKPRTKGFIAKPAKGLIAGQAVNLGPKEKAVTVTEGSYSLDCPILILYNQILRGS